MASEASIQVIRANPKEHADGIISLIKVKHVVGTHTLYYLLIQCVRKINQQKATAGGIFFLFSPKILEKQND